MGLKSQEIRIAECMNMRQQWSSQIGTPLPEELVEMMNDFVRDGQSSSGVIDFLGRKLFYQFACRDNTETYITLRNV